MKIVVIFLMLWPKVVFAQETMNEPTSLGLTAGLALACQVKRPLYIYEEIASRILANKASSVAVEEALLREYAQAKLQGYLNQKNYSRVSCSTVIQSFQRMPIFQFQLYSDGSLKTPEGTYLLPRGQKYFNPEVTRIYPK